MPRQPTRIEPVEERGLAGIVLAVVAASALAVPAAARELVDPATLNPPPPGEFNPECYRLGNGTQCTLAFSDPSVADAPSGIVCDGVELIDSFTRSVVGTRAYDSDGDLLRRHFEESSQRLVHESGDWLGRDYIGHDKILNHLAVPGDQPTGTTIISGPSMRTTGPEGQTVVMDVGSFLEGPTGLIRESGQHAFFEYFELGETAALQPLCEALD
jgi:hypothetical protein